MHGLTIRSQDSAQDIAAIIPAETAPVEGRPTSQNDFPKGWDEGKVQRVLTHYGEQSEGETLAEGEAADESPNRS
jgi:hypothetical protein